MRFALLLGCVVASAALTNICGAWAAPPAQLTEDGIIDRLAGKGDPVTPPSAGCPEGFDKDASGGCAQVIGPGGDLGFSIPRRATPGRAQDPRQSGIGAAPPPNAPRPSQVDLLLTFDLDSAKLTEQGLVNARVFVKALKDPRLNGMTFEIEGHTDATGSRDYNLALSQRRADAVKQFLVSQGINAERLTTVGYGFDRLANTAYPRGAENRRVVARRRQ